MIRAILDLMNGFVIRYLRVDLTASIAGFTDVPEPFFFLLILLRLACSVSMCAFDYGYVCLHIFL